MQLDKATKQYTITITNSLIFQLDDHVDEYSFVDYLEENKCAIKNEKTGTYDTFSYFDNDRCVVSLSNIQDYKAYINSMEVDNTKEVEIVVMKKVKH